MAATIQPDQVEINFFDGVTTWGSQLVAIDDTAKYLGYRLGKSGSSKITKIAAGIITLADGMVFKTSTGMQAKGATNKSYSVLSGVEK